MRCMTRGAPSNKNFAWKIETLWSVDVDCLKLKFSNVSQNRYVECYLLMLRHKLKCMSLNNFVYPLYGYRVTDLNVNKKMLCYGNCVVNAIKYVCNIFSPRDNKVYLIWIEFHSPKIWNGQTLHCEFFNYILHLCGNSVGEKKLRRLWLLVWWSCVPQH